MKMITAALALLFAGSLPALAHDVPTEIAKSPPTGAYKAVSGLVKLPDFLPGLGQLFVDPATLPAGPFLAYDRDGALVSTIYMLPISQLDGGHTMYALFLERAHTFARLFISFAILYVVINLDEAVLWEKLAAFIGAHVEPAGPSLNTVA